MNSILLTGVALIPLTGSAKAQTPPGTVAAVLSAPETAKVSSSTAAAEPTGLREIVVTAQRRAEPLQRAAIAVDVVSSEAVLASGVSKATDLTALVPALQGMGAGGSTSFYIREVGAFTANAYTDPRVAFN